MYTLELTDNSVIFYNQKTKKLIIEHIPSNVVVNNKIYDFEKLEKILKKIINKQNILNSFFKIKIKILIFEKYTPSDKYLALNLFKNFSNIKPKLIYPLNNYDKKHILISGNKTYHINKDKLIPKEEYILIGYIENPDIISSIEQELNIKLIKYENSTTIIYEQTI